MGFLLFLFDFEPIQCRDDPLISPGKQTQKIRNIVKSHKQHLKKPNFFLKKTYALKKTLPLGGWNLGLKKTLNAPLSVVGDNLDQRQAVVSNFLNTFSQRLCPTHNKSTDPCRVWEKI